MQFDSSKQSLKAAVAYAKLKASSVQYVLLRVRAAVGLFIRIIGFADGASATDSKIVAFGKAVSDAASTLESVAKGLAKATQDSAITADLRRVQFGKAVSDLAGASDTLTKATNKALQEVVGTSETKTFDVAKALVSVASGTDSLQRVVSYIRSFSDGSTASDLFALTSIKTQSESISVADVFDRAIGKVVADQVSALDDLNGASADDEQHIQFVKVLSEAALVSESFSRTVSYFRQYADSATATDLAAQTFTKLLFETVTAQDSAVVGRLVDRLEGEQAAVGDQAILLLAKQFVETVLAADAAAIAVSKAFTESVGLSDLTVKTADKGLTEGVSTYDSGNLFGQGYVSEDYFAERYVGYERTF